MNDEKTNKIMSSEELDNVLPKYEPIKLSGKNLAQNYVSAFNTGMNIYQCINYLQGNIDWTINAVNNVVKSWNTEVSESIDQSKAIVRETTTEQFNKEWTNKQPELIEQVNTLTTNQFNEDWGVLENRINTTLETQNTNIQNIQNEQNELETNTNNTVNTQNTKINSIQTQQNNLASNQTNLANQQTTLSNRMDTFTRLSEGSTTGDAELQDIRVGANGTTYDTAGNAVRGQYSQLKEDIVDINTELLNSGLQINYLLETESIKGSVWTDPNGGIYNSNDYKRWAEFTVPAGIYVFTNLSAPFSYYKNDNRSGALTESPLIVDVDTKIYASTMIDDKPTFIRREDLKTVYIGANRVFKTLTSGINFATSIGNCTVYVDDGVYDIINEYGGNNYFENLTENEVYQNPGIALGNNIHVIFSSGAKVVCNYTGNNQYVKKHFAPFNADKRLMNNGDFILENCICEASNVKYVVHDEYNGFNINYKHIYKNCKFKLDNTNNNYNNTQQSFGGGCGTYGYIELDGCDVTVVPINGEIGIAISWHNANNNYAGTDVSNNRIFIKNCITNGKILFSAYGNSEEISRMTICNSKFLGEPIHEYINNPPYCTVDNIEIIEWNNTKLNSLKQTLTK